MSRKSITTSLGIVFSLLTGCADVAEDAPLLVPANQPVVKDNARKLYILGEQKFIDGDYEVAFQLWRQVFLQLPSDARGDEFRHKLVGRMAFGLTQGFVATRDPSYLVRAKVLLERYLAKHEVTFGAGPEAVQERWDFVGLLVEIEGALESDLEASDGEKHSEMDLVTSAERDNPGQNRGRKRNTFENEVMSEPIYRHVVVTPKGAAAQADRDNISARRFFSGGLTGASMFEDTPDSLHGSRVLVRIGRPRLAARAEISARESRHTRKDVRTSVASVRPKVAECFGLAMGRVEQSWARLTVDFTIGPSGRIGNVTVSNGIMLDLEGDLCLLEVLESLPRNDEVRDKTIAVRLPLTIFYQPTHRTLWSSDALSLRPAGLIIEK